MNTTTGIGIGVNAGTVNVTDGTYTYPQASGKFIQVQNTGNLNISGGSISTTTAAIIYQIGGTVNFSGGTLSNDDSSYSLIGITNGTFNLTGGILQDAQSFIISGGILNIISGTYNYPSTSTYVFVWADGGTVNIKGGSIISGDANTLVFEQGAIGNMSGGTVSNNSTTGYAAIYVDSGATFVKTGGTVGGHGIYAASGSTCTGC